jgi:hypothetical protein
MLFLGRNKVFLGLDRKRKIFGFLRGEDLKG